MKLVRVTRGPDARKLFVARKTGVEIGLRRQDFVAMADIALRRGGWQMHSVMQVPRLPRSDWKGSDVHLPTGSGWGRPEGANPRVHYGTPPLQLDRIRSDATRPAGTNGRR